MCTGYVFYTPDKVKWGYFDSMLTPGLILILEDRGSFIKVMNLSTAILIYAFSRPTDLH